MSENVNKKLILFTPKPSNFEGFLSITFNIKCLAINQFYISFSKKIFCEKSQNFFIHAFWRELNRES